MPAALANCVRRAIEASTSFPATIIKSASSSIMHTMYGSFFVGISISSESSDCDSISAIAAAWRSSGVSSLSSAAAFSDSSLSFNILALNPAILRTFASLKI